MLVPGVHSDVGGGYRTGERREVKGDLGCFWAPKQLTKEGVRRDALLTAADEPAV